MIKLDLRMYTVVILLIVLSSCKNQNEESTNSQTSDNSTSMSYSDKGVALLLTALNVNTFAQHAINYAGTSKIFNCPDGGTATMNVPATFQATDSIDVTFVSCKVMGEQDIPLLCNPTKATVVDGKITYSKILLTPVSGSSLQSKFSLKGSLNYSNTVTGSCSFDSTVEGYESGTDVYLKWTGTLCGETSDILQDYVYSSKVCSYLATK